MAYHQKTNFFSPISIFISLSNMKLFLRWPFFKWSHWTYVREPLLGNFSKFSRLPGFPTTIRWYSSLHSLMSQYEIPSNVSTPKQALLARWSANSFIENFIAFFTKILTLERSRQAQKGTLSKSTH